MSAGRDWRVPLLALLAAFIVFAHLGEGHLANFDDCYYAEKAKEMVQGGDWITPHFAGIPRLDNPPLFLWLMAISFRVLGVTDYAAILFSALAGVLSIVLVHRLARRLRLDGFEAWCAGFVLLTTQYFLKYSRHAMFDVFLTFLFLVAIVAYVRALEGSRRWYLVVGIAAGLGVLTKSVLGLFPWAVAVVHLVWSGRARELRSPWLLGGLAMTGLVVAPWYGIQMHLAGDHFLDEHVRWLLWERGFGSDRAARPWWSYFDYVREIATLYWPWLPLAAAGMALSARRAFVGGRSAAGPAWSGADTPRLLIAWFAVVVGVMSLGAEKKLWYVMSVFPCLALFAAMAAGAWIRDETKRGRVVRGGLAVLLLGAVVLNLTPVLGRHPRRPDLQQIAYVTRATVPAGEKLLNLDARYWPIANQFLFYSGHEITQPLHDPAAVRRGLQNGRYALLTDRGYAEVVGADSTFFPAIAVSGAWRLVRAAPAIPATIPPAIR
jgi:4-amino-4-deoxy-L-arabinose transferase-like glycosyltransferase